MRRHKQVQSAAAEPPAATRQTPSIAGPLVTWYRSEKRPLPWRRNRDPYRVWVSEMMLQQTQVATVIDYYERWLKRFPTLRSLAGAQQDEVLHVWQGLGYYTRARRLLAGAQVVVRDHGGKLPRDFETLRALPGIGVYTAGAIASIAYDVPVAVIDGNVERVLSRLFAVSGDLRSQPHKRRLSLLASSLVPQKSPGDYNQALMELGATLCLPTAPDCSRCPVKRHCAANKLGRQLDFPTRPVRPKPTNVVVLSAFIRQGPRSLVVKLPPDAQRWADLWMFPSTELGQKQTKKMDLAAAVFRQVGVRIKPLGQLASLRHSVTRYRVSLKAYDCELTSGRARPLRVAKVAWKKPDEFAELAMPAAHRRLSRILTGRQSSR